MSGGFKYYAGAPPAGQTAGNAYVYWSDPVYECPYRAEIRDGGDQPLIAEIVGLLSAAAGFGELTNAPLALRLIRNAHRSGGVPGSKYDPGECPSCGAQMTKLGYETAVFDIGSDTGWMMERLGTRKRWPTKREAIAWAREEASIDRAAAREETTA